MSESISVLDNQELWTEVRFVHPIEGPLDVRTYDVEMACVVVGTLPEESDWFDAEWETDVYEDEGGDSWYLAHAEVGAGSGNVEFTAGQAYTVWARVAAPTVTPVLPGDTLVVQ